MTAVQAQNIPAGVPKVPAAREIARQIEAAVSAALSNVLSTFNVLFGWSVPVVLGAMIVAVLLLVAGWKLYRITLVMFGLLAGATLGLFLGDWISTKFAVQSAALPIASTVILSVLLGILAVPFVKMMVFIFCGAWGSVATSYLCQRVGSGHLVLWTVAAFIIVGLLSVLLIRQAMILFTSLLGSYVLVAGALAMCHRFGDVVIASRMNLVWPMILWLVLFLVGVRAQAGRGSEKKHIS